ncbi:MAG: hypothetical protein V1898_00110 [Patescibacteria group bacterium]
MINNFKAITRHLIIYPLIIIFLGFNASFFIHVDSNFLWIVYIIAIIILAYLPLIIYTVKKDRKRIAEDNEAKNIYAHLIGKKIKIEQAVVYNDIFIFHADGVEWHCASDGSREPMNNRYRIAEILGKGRVKLELIQ